MELNKLTIKDTVEGLKSKKFSASELMQSYASAIKENKNLNCFITETVDDALVAAKEADKAISDGSAKELTGIPIGVKDLFCTKGVRTTCASKMLGDFVPSYESTATQKLWDAGAIMVGKTSLDEFAMGSTNTTSHFGNVINPKSSIVGEDLVPGGSSGGSAAAVSANLCPAALGSDTGGSIRQPASITATVGVKPTYGRVSRYGMIAFASSLDQGGVFANSVYDAALVQRIISGFDANDQTTANISVPKFDQLLNSNIKGKRIGIPKEFRISLPASLQKAWDDWIKILENMGCKVSEISLPNSKYAPAIYYIIAPAECSSNLSKFDGVRYGFRTENADGLEDLYSKSRGAGFGKEVRKRIIVGTYVLSASHYDTYFKKAQQVRNMVLTDFKNAFKEVDVILTPSTPNTAFPIDPAKRKNEDSVKSIYLNDIFLIPASIAGVPSISIPGGVDESGLPFGAQIIANHFDEQTMFDVAYALEGELKNTFKC